MKPVLKTPAEIELMDEANRIVHRVLEGIGERIGPGVTPRQLDRFAEQTIRAAGGVPAFLRYRGYPATLCISVNDVIVHGIPDDAAFTEGDIVGIDCGVLYKGYYGDAAWTFAVGEVGEEARRLLQVTKEALDLAVAAGAAGRAAVGHRPCRAAPRGAARLLRRPRLLGPRHRHLAARGATDPQLRSTR